MDTRAGATTLRGLVIALAAVAGAIALRSLAEPWLQGRLPFVTLFGAVALAVWVGGAWTAALAAAVGFAASSRWLSSDESGVFGTGYLIAAAGYAFSCGLIIVFGELLRRTRGKLESEIAERARVVRELQESEEHYRHTVDFNPQVTWTAGPDGQLDRVAERWTEWTGRSGLGSTWGSLLHADDLAPTVAAWRRSVETGAVYDIEHRIRMRSGAYRWMRSRAQARRGDDGRVTTWYGTTEDVHERKLAEARLNELNATLEQQVAARTAALQASQAQLQTIFSSSFQYQGLLRPDGTVLDMNATALRAIGAERSAVIGRLLWDTPWFADTPGIATAVRKSVEAAAAGQSVRHELVLNLPGGRRRLDFAVRPVIDAHGAVTAVLPEAVDVTDRHDAEEKLRQAQKMEAIGQLTGGVAHDFNNLLQVISANLQLIGKRVAGDAKAQSRIASAQGAVRNGARLASQLLAFGRRQALEPRVVNAGRLAVGMEDMLRRSLGESIEIETVVYGGMWNTFVDPTQIESAILNLAINARDAMAGRGKLTVEVGNAFLDDSYTRRHAEVNAGQYVMIAVSDTGQGMSPEVAARAFEPFFSTKPPGSGTGLGLSMVYGFVKQSEGHVKIYSEPGQGTTVKIYLPRSLDSETPPRDVDEPVATAGQGETILVVEDDDGVRETAAVMLGDLGYRVLVAPHADAALTIVDDGPPLDLLFTDVVMPGSLKSTELARLARARYPALQVLFTSGYTQNAVVHGGRLDPGVELLVKPYTQEDLARRVAALLGSAAPSPSAAAVGGPAHAASAPTGPPETLAVLLVAEDDAARATAAGLLRELSHVVSEARTADEALARLADATIDLLLVADPAPPGLASAARWRRPGLPIVLATDDPAAVTADRQGTDDTRGPVVLRTPYGRADLEGALLAALRS